MFSRLVEKADETRHLPAELAAEAAVRAGSGRLGVKELRLLLLRFKGTRLAAQATASAWAVVRARPELATSVLHSHAQESGVPTALVVRDLSGGGPGLFVVQAGWRDQARQFHGAAVTRGTKKAALQGAVVSLLGHMSGCEPVDQAGFAEKGWLPAARYAAGSVVAIADATFASRLLSALAQPVVAPAVVAEVASRIAAGALIPRDLHAVLFDAASSAWEPARKAVLIAAAETPGAAVAVLTLYHSVRKQPVPEFEEEQKPGGAILFRSRITYVTDGETATVTGPWRTNKRDARGVVALRVLADLAGLPVEVPPPRQTQPPAPVTKTASPSPQDRLLVMQQGGVISELTFKEQPSITGLEPLFVCVAACVSNGQVVSGTGRSVGRSGARLEAAKLLLGECKRTTAPALPVWHGKENVPALNEMTALQVLNQLKQKGRIDKLVVGKPRLEPGAGYLAAVTCQVAGQQLRVEVAGAAKRPAQRNAAKAMLELLAAPPGAAPPDAPAAPAPDIHDDRVRHGPAGPVAGADDITMAEASLAALLRQGAELTIDIHGGTARFLLYSPDGLPLQGSPPRPIRACTAALILPSLGSAIQLQLVECWHVPLRLLANVLAAAEEQGKETHSVRVWRQVIRLGLTVVASGRVFPQLADDGADVWRAGPLTGEEEDWVGRLAEALVPPGNCGMVADSKPHRLWAPRVAILAGLDAVAEAMLRGPGTPTVLGNGPFTGAVPRQQHAPALVQWGDDLRDGAASQAMDLVLSVRAPQKDSPDDTELLWADLRLRMPDAPTAHERNWRRAADIASDPQLVALLRRRLRHIAADWAPAERLLERPVPDTFTLRAAEAVLLRGRTARQLERAGLRVEWHHGWTDRLRTRAVLERRPAGPVGTTRPRFALDDVLDGRWQLSVAGVDLSDSEMDDLAKTPVPLAKVRRHWVLLDEETAQRAGDRVMGPVAADQALRASLTGQISIEGNTFDCEPAGNLAELVQFLRDGSRSTPVKSPHGLSATMRDYQKLGLAWLANTTDAGFGALLADDMGLGKSLTALALHLHRRDQACQPVGPSLIVCPASMLINWEREVQRFAPTVPTARYHGPDRTLDGTTARTVVITTYETVRRDIDILAAHPFDLVIADEAQLIKNHRTATAMAMRRIQSQIRIALTGTPVENSLTDAWSLMDWLNPGLFGALKTFREQFGRPIEENITDTELTDRLSSLLRAFMLRRRKSDPGVLPELPPKVYSPRIVALTPEQAALYQRVADDTLREIRSAEGIARKGLLLKLFDQLQKIYNSPEHFLNEALDDSYDPERAAARSGKLAALDDLLPVLRDPDESCLIFTRYRAMAHRLVHHLQSHNINPLYFSGDICAGRDRQRIVDTFQSRPGQTMVITVKAGGTGLTLTQASHVILFDRPWNPAKEGQAIDRAHRLGQTRTVTVRQLTTENTLEDRIDELLRHKRALADAILTSDSSALSELTDDEICELIALGAPR
ncbi:DEAD/DEAH box helicase [Streptomyces sp. MB09-02B]|uniref:DEAD/DEAH box helicase n=1 Tax=Streptomyces sp. MB09-02B TaxID=3028667 RepID=UPI0029A53557|nr:DEAD/DEAH box helicase [Streptomyces sp. MB09-02B]MDX3643942.1 DEAD/DEAH box helicase [Streptomyces sp. MB09-02B]